jgi:predicted kinase
MPVMTQHICSPKEGRPTLVIVRGVPGVGKSTFVRQYFSEVPHFEADMRMIDPRTGAYQFDRRKLGEAHRWCQRGVEDALMLGCEQLRGLQVEFLDVVVSNTFTTHREMKPYLAMAKRLDCGVEVIDLFDGGFTVEELVERNVHGVPSGAIRAMIKRYEHGLPND